MMKKRVLHTYSFIVSILLLLVVYSFLYQKYWHSQVYLQYLPDEVVYSQYDLETNEEVNSTEVNYREASDYVPTYGVLMYVVYNFIASWGALFYIVLLILIVPALFYCKSYITVRLGVLTGLQLIVIFVMLRGLII